VARHLIFLLLNDDLGDIESETDLESFIDDLKDCNPAEIRSRYVYDVTDSEDFDESS
jgi:hypothetical protein